MKKAWMKIAFQITDNFRQIQHFKCPNCGKHEIEYLYIGDKETRVGYLQVWCNGCLKGVYVSRVTAPLHARFLSFNESVKDIIPEYEFVED